MQWKQFHDQRDDETIKRWYTKLHRSDPQRQTKFRDRFAKWECLSAFHQALDAIKKAAASAGVPTFVQIGQGFHRHYLCEFFECYACDHLNRKSIKKNFDDAQRSLEFLAAWEELPALIEALDPNEFT
jgi:hypothetical protein